MTFVDTGYFVALLDSLDALHDRARAGSRIVEEPILTTEHVLLETVNCFSAVIDRPKIHAFLKDIGTRPRCEWVRASPVLWEAGVRLHGKRMDKDWSLTDRISFVIMDEKGIRRALAYDRHFEQAGFEALLRRDPP